jgi:hypothetical protein
MLGKKKGCWRRMMIFEKASIVFMNHPGLRRSILFNEIIIKYIKERKRKALKFMEEYLLSSV